MAKKIRVDKWLWTVRIFKSRTKATDACKSRKVSIAGKPIKASYMVQAGEILEVKKGGYNLVYEVVSLLKTRVSAVLAAPCYINLTPEDELKKFESWFIGKGAPEKREKGTGRPTKKNRRELEDYKDQKYQ